MLKSDILYYSRQENMGGLDPWFESLLDNLIDQEIYPNHNVLQEIGVKLEHELKTYKNLHNINTAVIGLSGGVDSALTAALFKSAGWTVKPILLPIHQNPEETKRADETAATLGLEHTIIDLSNSYDKLIKDIKTYDPDITKDPIRSGNIRVRLRMMTLYNLASKYKGLVASTDNFSELAAGFWTLHGDVGDLAPIQSLCKSWEVPKLAEYYNVPQHTVMALPTDGLGISKGDEDQFGFSYLEFDCVLLTLCSGIQPYTLENIMTMLNPPTHLANKVKLILQRIKNNVYKRQNPCNIQHPFNTTRYNGLAALDKCLLKASLK
jgi:nicotinamide-nucleotide amidase